MKKECLTELNFLVISSFSISFFFFQNMTNIQYLMSHLHLELKAIKIEDPIHRKMKGQTGPYSNFLRNDDL